MTRTDARPKDMKGDMIQTVKKQKEFRREKDPDFRTGYLSDGDKLLLSLLLGKKPSAEDIDRLIGGSDFDRENQNRLLMISRVGMLNGWEHFPPVIVPRLKGIHKYWQVHNSRGIPFLIGVISVLEREKIPVMLLKGLAMRYHFASGMPRMMGDYDIAVPEDLYGRSVEALKEEGFEVEALTADHHGKVFGGSLVIELHRWVFKNHGDAGTDIWEKAVHFDFYGHDVCSLCPEDMFIHQMDNRSGDMFQDEFHRRRMNWLLDCGMIVNRAGGMFDLRSLAERAGQFSASFRSRRMLRIFADTYPDLVSLTEIDEAFPPSKEYDRWLSLGIKYHDAVESMRLHGDTPESVLTPGSIFRRMRAQYRYYRFWKNGKKGRSFRKYLLNNFNVSSFSELVRKYRSRIKLAGPGASVRTVVGDTTGRNGK